MVNPEYDILKDWMFGKLNTLLQNLEPNPEYSVLKMSIGEPSLKIPDFVKDILETSYEDWGKYPPSSAIPSFGKSIIKYIEKGIQAQKTLLI